jgi:hypothetical protein
MKFFRATTALLVAHHTNKGLSYALGNTSSGCLYACTKATAENNSDVTTG